MRAAGLGFLIAAVSMAFLLAFPGKKGEHWAKWTLLTIALIHSGIMSMVVASVRSHTGSISRSNQTRQRKEKPCRRSFW
jgi:hypothetical protein